MTQMPGTVLAPRTPSRSTIQRTTGRQGDEIFDLPDNFLSLLQDSLSPGVSHSTLGKRQQTHGRKPTAPGTWFWIPPTFWEVCVCVRVLFFSGFGFFLCRPGRIVRTHRAARRARCGIPCANAVSSHSRETRGKNGSRATVTTASHGRPSIHAVRRHCHAACAPSHPRAPRVCGTLQGGTHGPQSRWPMCPFPWGVTPNPHPVAACVALLVAAVWPVWLSVHTTHLQYARMQRAPAS